MFVGDSISLNQWQSLICMLHAAVPTAMSTLSRKGDVSSLVLQALPPILVFNYLFVIWLYIDFNGWFLSHLMINLDF